MPSDFLWDHDRCLDLIAEYSKYENLWNPKDKNFFNNSMKEQTWNQISQKFGRDLDEVKRKMESLKSSFRRESLRVRRGRATSWFGFEALKFLNKGRKKIEPETPEIVKSEIEIQENNLEYDQSPNQSDDEFDDEPESPAPAVKMERKRFVSYRQPQKRVKSYIEDPRINEVFNIIKNLRPKRDETSVFVEHVAFKLRKFNDHLRAEVEHQINNILYSAETGTLSYTVPSNKI